MKKEHQISVSLLVEHVLHKGDLNLAFGLFDRTAGLKGIRAHQKLQRQRPDNYAYEIPVSRWIESENVSLLIQGRIDGICRVDGKIIIEEIKTTSRDLDTFMAEFESLHWGQVMAYAAMYAEENELESVSARLTYLQHEKGTVKTFTREFSREELEVFFFELTKVYLQWIEKLESWRDLRDKNITEGEFPFDSFRAGQQRMARDVYQTIKQEGQLIIQAPTGIGKTIGVLFPAVKALAEGYTDKIFYLTARTTGRIIAQETLSGMAQNGMRLKSVILTAKDKICFNPEKNCTAEECEYAKGFYDRIQGAWDCFFMEDIFTLQSIQETAKQFRVCPFELSLDLTVWADCVICDFNYAFAPGVYLKRFFAEVTENYTFLIDEAHNLVDRARDMFSARIKKAMFLKVRRLLKEKKSGVYLAAGKANAGMLALKKAMDDEVLFQWEEKLPDKLLPALRQYTLEIERWYKKNAQSAVSALLLDHYFEVSRFLRVADQFDESYASGLEICSKDLFVSLFCIDPAGQMRQGLERARSVVFFSATMTPVDYFARLFGCREEVQKRILTSPFLAENLCVLVDGTVSTLYRHRHKTAAALARNIGCLVDARKGNYLIFFPSYAYMKMVYPYYIEGFKEHNILIQRTGMTEPEREDFLARFSHENESTLVGFVVMGGIFGEAIDLVGDRLSGAVIVGVGLPGISPERELIRSYFEDKEEPGFAYSYQIPGIIRVLQAAGRVIRSESDQGTVMLIDRRYLMPQYSELLPGEWQVVKVHNTEQTINTLKTFWGHPEK